VLRRATHNTIHCNIIIERNGNRGIDMQGTDWEAARRLTRDWLQHEGITAAKLANRANVQRSVVSRFLNGQPITPQTAARLCDAMQPALSPAERITLMETFGLSRFSQLAGVSAATLDLPPDVSNQPQDCLFVASYIATHLWKSAIELAKTSWLKSIPVFFEAERAFGYSSTAALAGLCGVQVLINIGDFNAAEREVIRIQTAYAGEMDTLTRAEVAVMGGWIAFDRGEFGHSLKWFKHNLDLPPHNSLLHIIDGAHHFSARNLLEMSQQQTDAEAASRMLHEAEQHMRLSLQMKQDRDASVAQIGFDHLRLMEVLDAAGKHAEARVHRRKANEIFAGNGADLHIALHTAEQDLDEGDTKRAIKKGMAGLEGWREYANGFARSAGMVAQGKLEEDKAAQALRYAALAHAFQPRYAHHSDRPRAIDLVHEASRLIVHQQGRRKHDALVRQMKDDAQSRTGEFAHLSRAPVDHSPALLALCDQLLQIKN
jgi:transcriptional regulator with XRE-family HTH domain